MKSGREDLSLADRQGLLASDALWLQGFNVTRDEANLDLYWSTSHARNQLLGAVRSCTKDSDWARRNISKVECMVLAWRRGGYAEYLLVHDEAYPRR